MGLDLQARDPLQYADHGRHRATGLTACEVAVIRALWEHRSTEDAARALGLSPETVKTASATSARGSTSTAGRRCSSGR